MILPQVHLACSRERARSPAELSSRALPQPSSRLHGFRQGADYILSPSLFNSNPLPFSLWTAFVFFDGDFSAES